MPKRATPERPSFIRHWSEIERAAPILHPHSKEPMVRTAPFSARFEIRRIGIRHDTIMPGWRSSQPHAERDEEEMVHILEGTPDLWIDGYIYRLKPGDTAGWPGRDGMAHCLINNTGKPVRMLTIGEASRYNSKIHFPLTRDMDEWLTKNDKLWIEPPKRKLGPHDGLPDAVRGKPSPASSIAKLKPPCVVDWKKISQDNSHYPNDDELMAVWSHLTVALGITRIGVGHDLLQPGRRTSWPHAEFDEEEFVYVAEGTPDVWIDGHLHRLREGDGAGFPDRTGISHCFINNTDKPVRLITVGEASRRRSKCVYPLHPKRNKEIGDGLWKDAPKMKLGPHDGMSDLRRAEVKKRARK
ncbi:MAG: cupin domain-containing protein [Alphaproteobacteria bacterium]|nr:cupin domain-containing protein [Alphaproteobacteria bacterium]